LLKRHDIPAVYRVVKQEYEKRYAPVRGLAAVQREDPFRVLVTTILSARTKDETTCEVAERLFGFVKKPADFDRIPLRKLERIVFPIGFFRTKARHLKRLPRELAQRFGGKIPDTIEGLCELPGVGRKTANLVLSVAFDKPAICVDVHVHRIANRLGLIGTATPLETEMKLREILPVRFWKSWNPYFVSFGQTVCRPVRPRCAECPLRPYCCRVGV
jgi:endonuclease III